MVAVTGKINDRVVAGTGYGPISANDPIGIANRYKRFIAAVLKATPGATAYGMQPVFDQSQIYVPVDKGDLKRSGYMEAAGSVAPIGSPRVLEIGYGKNGFPDYAVKVHEDLEKFHHSPTQAKFLERAFNEKSKEVLSRIAGKLKV